MVAVEQNPRLQQEHINMARQDLPLRFAYGVQVADPALGQVVQALQGFQDTYVGQNQAPAAREAARDAANKLPGFVETTNGYAEWRGSDTGRRTPTPSTAQGQKLGKYEIKGR
jgi:hypothetical protein